jgi:hypothetical protein
MAQAVKVMARAHQSLAWERARLVLLLGRRPPLRDFLPAALVVFDDLTAVPGTGLLG